VDEAERQRFEQLNPNLAFRRRASICFKSLRWEGRSHSFTNLQARFLHRHYDAGLTTQPWLNGKCLLAECQRRSKTRPVGGAKSGHLGFAWRCTAGGGQSAALSR
jgi:hypothetical protein